MNGRVPNRYACECRDCVERREREWDAFVAGHAEVANHLRDTFLNPEGRRPVERVLEHLRASREAGTVTWDDGS